MRERDCVRRADQRLEARWRQSLSTALGTVWVTLGARRRKLSSVVFTIGDRCVPCDCGARFLCLSSDFRLFDIS